DRALFGEFHALREHERGLALRVRHGEQGLLLRVVGAAVVVVLAVEILGLQRAFGLCAPERVTVGVRRGAGALLGIGRRDAGHVRARVVRVEDAVAVVVGIGAAVRVLEIVVILGLRGALVVVVEDAVAVLIALGAAVSLGVVVGNAGERR